MAKKNQLPSGIQDTTISDEAYWKQYVLDTDKEGFGKRNHEINLEVACKFRGMNRGVIYETKESAINCNLQDLETWFKNLKRIIRMLDETIVDKEVGRF